MQVEIDSIRIRRRVRKDVGNITALVESMKRYGQFSPIIVNRKMELIAGFRRLTAARQIGWHSINAVVVDEESEAGKLEIELEENVQRKALTHEELSEGFARLEELRKPRLWRRILEFFKALFRRLFRRRGSR